MDLKQKMLEYFQRPEVNQQIADYVAREKMDYNQLTNDQLMNILDQLNILDPLLDQIADNEQPKVNPLNSVQIQQAHSTKNLKIYLERGRKFKQWPTSKKNDKFFISLCGFGQKATTNSRFLQQSFTIGEQIVFSVDSDSLKTSNVSPLELSIIKIQNSGCKSLYAVKMIEWRYVLAHGSVSFDIQLSQYNRQGLQPVSVGILSLKLCLYPLSKFNMVQQMAVDRQIQLELKNQEKYNNRFYSYANQFWNEYKSIHSIFQSRRIKLYGQSEDRLFIPMCKFVKPLYNVRGIDSPQHALRICSLIPLQEQQLNLPSLYKRFHSIISGFQGSVDDHCHLLCSLLLGFGLKSYVCIGTNYKGDHSWVITQDYKNGSIMFWQCTKGIKYDFFSPKIIDLYRSIHVVYNHQEFYANIQLDDSVAGSKYKFNDSTKWKSIDKNFLENIPSYNTSISLCSPTFDAIKIEKNLENILHEKIQQFRKNNKLSFHQDMVLASILSTALANYEIERLTGLTFCEQQFENAIKNYIPAKHTFKAFPIQLLTLDPDQIMQSLTNNAKCRDILLTNGDNVHFGLRSKLVLYPDNIFAYWLSVGVRYYKVN